MSLIDELDKHDFNSSALRLDKPSSYLIKKARRSLAGLGDLEKSMKSSTVYVGNLSFFTTEEQIYELFSKCGDIQKIIMGLDLFQKTPCGFCFVIYQERQLALDCAKYLSGTKLDNEPVDIDIDSGFEEGRQLGRGKSGGQVKNEYQGSVNNYGNYLYNAEASGQHVRASGGNGFEDRRNDVTDSYVPGEPDLPPIPQ